jgi:hypothetical protein
MITPAGGTIRIPISSEGGYLTQMINKTGAPSVKGTIVSASTAHANSFMLQANEYDAIGAVYEDGIADGDLCSVVTHGIADLLLEDTTAAVLGAWVKCSSTDGRADASQLAPSGGGFVNATEHFKEIGHCLEAKNAGSDVLARCLIHFN